MTNNSATTEPKNNTTSSAAATTATKSLISYLWFFIKLIYPYEKVLFISFVATSILSNLAPQVENYITGRVLEKAIELLSTTTGSDKLAFYLAVLAATYFVSSLIFNLYEYFKESFWVRFDNFSMLIHFEKLLTLPISIFENSDFIKLKNKVDYNGWKLPQGLSIVINIIGNVIALISAFVLLFAYSPAAICFATLSVVPKMLVVKKFGKAIWTIWDSLADDKIKFGGLTNPLLQDSSSAFSELKVFGYGKYLMTKAFKLNSGFIDRRQKNEQDRLKFGTLAQIWVSGFAGLGLYFIFDQYLKSNISISQLYFALGLFNGFRNSIMTIATLAAELLADKPFFKAFYDFYNYPTSYGTLGTNQLKCTTPPTITFANVSFTYPNTKNQVLKKINLTIPAGANIAIVGKNGAGKTTLMKLLLKVYEPDTGEILVGNQNIKAFDLGTYYQNFTHLSQDFTLPRVQIWDSIYLGDTSKPPDMAGIILAAKKAKAHDFIDALPQKYESYLTRELSDGVELSGGQRQRLAIARAFYRNAPIMILDEPTSAIDALAEEEIFANVRFEAKDQTIIIISHRFATVKKADYIVVLDNGEIIQQGTHAELLADVAGLYYQMFTTQAG